MKICHTEDIEFEERVAIKIFHGNIPERKAIEQATREQRDHDLQTGKADQDQG